MYTTQKSPEPYRATSVNRGHIPSIATMDSGIRLPDNNIEEFYRDKAREQWAITKQVYPNNRSQLVLANLLTLFDTFRLIAPHR